MPRLLASLPLLLATVLVTTSAQAHFFPETASCKAPVPPLEFITELDRKAFEAKVTDYRGCLENFVARQNEAINKHRQAAEKAADSWKQYAKNVLKVELKAADSQSQ